MSMSPHACSTLANSPLPTLSRSCRRGGRNDDTRQKKTATVKPARDLQELLCCTPAKPVS